MKPLREDTSSPDPLIARAAALLSAIPRLDLGPSRRRLPAVGAPSRHNGLTVRVALVLAATLASAAAGATTLRGTGWLESLRSMWTHPAAATAPAGQSVAPGPSSRVDAPSAPAVDPEASGSLSAPPPVTFGVTASSRGLRTRETPKGPAASTLDESALVLDAVRALRRDHDPKRARELSQQALLRYPQGAQVEEAMAIAMESASAEGDSAAARVSANRYLERFPTGRFADRARYVLGDSLR